MTVLGLALAGSLVATSLGGCSKYTEPFKDAPRTGVNNGVPADLIRMPDGFSNMATKCDHGNRVYVVYHGDNAYGAMAVVANDSTCVGERQ